MTLALTTLDQILNLLMSVVSMHVFKKYKFEDMRIMWGIRMGYFLSQSILFLMLYLINRNINTKNDMRVLKIKTEDGEEEITYSNYDKEEYKKVLRSSIVQFVLVTSFHIKWKMPAPLVIQSFGVFKNLVLNPLFLTHIRNKEVLRPFEENVLFESKVKETEKKRKKEE